MAMMQPTARAMIGVPRKLMKSALTPAMENAEARPIRMMGRTIGRKCEPAARQLAEFGHELLIGLDVAVRDDVVGSLDLLADVLCEEVARDQRRDGAQSAEAHDQQQIIAAAQRTGSRDGAGCGRDEAVADVQAHGQCDGHRDARRAGPAGHSLADGVQNDEAAVTEHGDGDDPAHELDGKLRMLFADELDHAVGHFERRAGALKQRTDQSAEDDHDADARERAREAGADDVGNAADGVAVGVRGVDQRNTGRSGRIPEKWP